MIFAETELRGAYVIDLELMEDERGFFARAWCQNEFSEHGLHTFVVQSNMSYNKRRGTLRGMHFQVAPHEEAKLIRCTRGALYDVTIDLQPDSPTYMKWMSVELTADSHRMLYVPEGFAHGYQTLEDDTEVFYQASEFYAPQAERGIRWDDPRFDIRWPHVEERIISEKDASWPNFSLETRIGRKHDR